MSDANYATEISGDAYRTRISVYAAAGTTSSSPRLTTWNSSSVVADSADVNVVFFR